MPRYLLPHEKKHPQRSCKRTIAFMIGFELLTLPAGAWGYKSGLPFWSVMPGAFFCGLLGGAFLSVGVYALQTGFMQRMDSFYRFSERPGSFIMDSLMVLLGIAMAAAWPIGFAIQEHAKQQPTSPQTMTGKLP